MKVVYRIGAVFFTLSVFLIIGFISIIGPVNSKAFYKSQFTKEYEYGYTVLGDVRYQAENLEDEKAKEYIANITDEQLVDLMMHTIKYCLFLEDDLNITVDGEYLEIFREDEYSHMEDVKGIFGGGIILIAVAFVIFGVTLALGLIKKKGYYENAKKIPYYTLICVFVLLAFIGIAAAINFDVAFDVFHMIFFNGNWIFSDGVMISMIGNIFYDLVPIILVIWVVLLAIFVGIIRIYNGYLSKKFE